MCVDRKTSLSVVRMCRLWRVHISTVLEQSVIDEPYCRPLVVRTSATCQSISKYIECDGVSFASPILAVHQRRSGKAWWHAGHVVGMPALLQIRPIIFASTGVVRCLLCTVYISPLAIPPPGSGTASFVTAAMLFAVTQTEYRPR